MWVFYHNVATADSTHVSIDSITFVAIIAAIGLVVLAPSYFERKDK